jgi:hypothetical protein
MPCHTRWQCQLRLEPFTEYAMSQIPGRFKAPHVASSPTDVHAAGTERVGDLFVGHFAADPRGRVGHWILRMTGMTGNAKFWTSGSMPLPLIFDDGGQ